MRRKQFESERASSKVSQKMTQLRTMKSLRIQLLIIKVASSLVVRRATENPRSNKA